MRVFADLRMSECERVVLALCSFLPNNLCESSHNCIKFPERDPIWFLA